MFGVGVLKQLLFCFFLIEMLFALLIFHSLMLGGLEGLHLFFLQFLHESVAVFELYLILFDAFVEEGHLLPDLLVFLEELVGLGLEVV